MAKKKATEFDKLARLITAQGKEAGSMEERLMVVIKGESEDIRNEMRGGFARVNQELASIRAELK